MKYHIVLDLTPEQIKELKHKAIHNDLTGKELVKRAIVEYLKTLKEEGK